MLPKWACTLQWIPAHILAMSKPITYPRLLDFPILIQLTAAVSLSHQVSKNSIPGLNCNRIVSYTIDKLRTNHLKGLKISLDGQRSYNICLQCPENELSPDHIFISILPFWPNCLVSILSLLTSNLFVLRGLLT